MFTSADSFNADSTINVFVSSFSGLGLPQTICVPTSPNSSIVAFTNNLADRLPDNVLEQIRITTVSGRAVNPASTARISTLLSSTINQHGRILSLRLSVPLLGGKGGFGSQLRAAGGRMSSRKKKNQGDPNASSRNLDGRRLRTVTEAKALAEYLAVKPEMDKKEKEERRKRWEQVVDAAEKRGEEIRNGNGGGSGKIDSKWLEEKEESESKTRDAIVAAMRQGLLRDDSRKLFDQIDEESDEDEEGEDDASDEGSSKDTTPPSEREEIKLPPRRKIFGWDDEEEDELSESDDDAPAKKGT